MNTIPEERELMASIEEQANPLILAKDALTAGDLRERLLNLKEISKRVEARKQEITRPMREALASARELFRPLETRLEEANTSVRNRILAVEKEREKEQAKLAAKVVSGKMGMDEATELMVPQESSMFRMVKKLVIKDKKLIPKKYLVIDEVALRADLMAGKKVPGAALIEEKTVVAR